MATVVSTEELDQVRFSETREKNPQWFSPPPSDLGVISAVAGNVRLGFNALPEAVAFRSVRNLAADFYAALDPYGINKGEGLIYEEDFKANFQSQHPGMIGKWKKGMSWHTASNLLDQLNTVDDATISVSETDRPFLGFVTQTLPQFFSPTNYIAVGSVAKGTSLLKGVAKAAAMGAIENVGVESGTYLLQKYVLQEQRQTVDLLVAGIMGSVIPGSVRAGARGLELRADAHARTLDNLAKEALGVADKEASAAKEAFSRYAGEHNAHIQAKVEEELRQTLEKQKADKEAQDILEAEIAAKEADAFIESQRLSEQKITEEAATLPVFNATLRTEFARLIQLGAASTKDAYKAARTIAQASEQQRGVVRSAAEAELGLGGRRDRRFAAIRDLEDFNNSRSEGAELPPNPISDSFPDAEKADEGLDVNINEDVDRYGQATPEAFDPGVTSTDAPATTAAVLYSATAQGRTQINSEFIPAIAKASSDELRKAVELRRERLNGYLDQEQSTGGNKGLRDLIETIEQEIDLARTELSERGEATNMPRAKTGASISEKLWVLHDSLSRSRPVEGTADETIKQMASGLDSIVGRQSDLSKTAQDLLQPVRQALVAGDKKAALAALKDLTKASAESVFNRMDDVSARVSSRAADMLTKDKSQAPTRSVLRQSLAKLSKTPDTENLKAIALEIRGLRDRFFVPKVLSKEAADSLKFSQQSLLKAKFDKLFEATYVALKAQNIPAVIKSLDELVKNKNANKMLSAFEYGIYIQAVRDANYRSSQKERAESDAARKSPETRKQALQEINKAGKYSAAMRARSLSLSEWQAGVLKQGQSNVTRSAWFRFMSDFLAPYGRELRIYDHKDPVNSVLFGEGRGATHWSDGDTLYIAADQLDTFEKGYIKQVDGGEELYVPGPFNPDSMLSVIGHEIAHTVRFRSETAYRKLVDNLLKTNDQGLRNIISDTLYAFEQSTAFRGFSPEKQFDEVMANVLGHAFKNKAFWETVQNSQGRNGFLKLVDYVARYVSSILSKITRDTDPNTAKSVRRMVSDIETAMRAPLDATKATSPDSGLGRVYSGVANRYREILTNVDLDRNRAFENADRIADEITFELPDEAPDGMFTIPKIGKTSLIPTDFEIKLTPAGLAEFNLMSKKERAAWVYARFYKQGEKVEAFQTHLNELKRARADGLSLTAKKELSEGAYQGDIGEPFVAYRVNKNSIQLYVGYPDDYGTIGIHRERYEHSRNSAMVRAWVGLPELTQANINPVAAELANLHDLTRRIFEEEGSAKDKRLNQSSAVVREFIESPEFKEILDFYEINPGRFSGDSDKITPLTPNEAADFSDIFVEAMRAYTYRITNEYVERGAIIPDKYASWQDRLTEFESNADLFLSESDKIIIDPADIGPGRAQLAALYAKHLESKSLPSTPATRRKLLDMAVASFVDELNKVRKKRDADISKKAEASAEQLPPQVKKQLKEAAETIKLMKERGNTFSGSLEDMASLLNQEDYEKFSWTHILDHRGYGADLHTQVFQRYAAQVDLSKPHAWVQIYDLLADDLFRETQLKLHETQDYLLSQMSLVNDLIPLDADHLKRAADWLNKNANPLTKTTIDGVTHTNIEHAVYDIMRSLVGEADFNKWILWNEPAKRESLTLATLEEYEAREKADLANRNRKSAAPQSFVDEVESAKKKSSPSDQDFNDYEAAQDLYVEPARTFENPSAFSEEATNAPRIDAEELGNYAQKNAEQELDAVTPFLNKPIEARLDHIRAIEKTLKDLGTAFPETLRAFVSKAENKGRALMKTTQVVIDEFNLGLNAKALLSNDLGLEEDIALAGRRALLTGSTAPEAVRVMMDVAKERATHELHQAYLDVEAIARNTSSIAQLHTNIDGQIRSNYAGTKTALRQVAGRIKSAFSVTASGGRYMTVARSIDSRLKHAKQIATHGIHAAFDAIPKMSRSAQENATLVKAAIKSMGGPEAFKDIDLDPAMFAMVQKLGNEISRSLEIVRGMLNKGGANVKKNDQFFFSLKHSLPLIRADVFAWNNYLISALDWDKVAKNLGQESISNRGAFLEGMLADLEKAERNTETAPFDPASVNLGSRDQWHRTLAFKDTDAMVDYDMRFGSTDTFSEILNQLNRRAERSVILEEYGPNYAKNFNHILDLSRREATNKADKAIMAAEEVSLKTTFRYVTGELNNPVNQTVAAVGQFIRLVGNAAFSWKSSASSLTDVPLTQMVLRSAGAKYQYAMGKHLQSVFTNSRHLRAETKRFYEGNLAGLETIISASVRGSLDVGESGAIGRANDKIYSLNGQQHVTKTAQYAYADIMAHHLGDQARLISEGGKLDPNFLSWLSKYKISETDFRRMAESSRDVALHINGAERTVLLPSMIEDRALRHHLLSAFKDSMDTAVLQPSSSDIASLTFGIRSGTIAGETVRCVTHYKSFTMAMNTKVRRHFRTYGLSEDSIDKLMLHRFYGIAGLAGAGLLATQLSDIMDGREPLHFMTEDQRNLTNVKRVIMKAGMFTAMSDLGFSMKQNRDGTSSPDFTLSSALGPVPGQVLRFGQQIASDDPTSGARATRTALNLLPGATLPFVGSFKHEAIGAIFQESYGFYNEGFLRRIETITGQDPNIFDNR